MAFPRPPAAALLAAALLAPAAAAHSHVETADGKFSIVVGLLDEPVVTYQKTGLDLCFSHHAEEGEEAEPVSDANPLAIRATLVAPSGATLTQDLRGQFGRPGCFQFTSPFVLTEPGQYNVTLTGDLHGTALDFTGIAAGGAVRDASLLTFPDSGIDSLEALEARVASLEADNAALEAEVAELKQGGEAEGDGSNGSKGSPSPVAPLLLLGLLALVALRRR